MQQLIHMINLNMPESLMSFFSTLHTSPAHIILFIFLLSFIVFIKFLFRNFIRKFILIRLYKKRNSTFYRLLSQRFEKLIRPLRYIISLFIFKIALHLFFKGETIEFVFYIFFLLLFSWWFYEIIKFIIYTSLSINIANEKEIHQELFVLFLNIAKVLIALIIIFVTLARMGIDLTGLATSLGIGGILLGLSAKDTLTNFFDSIRLIGENAFHIGDWIETEHVEGVVTEIGLAATCIRTFDNALVTIPNSKLAGSYIKNWSKRKVGRQIKFNLKLKYTYDMQELERVIDEIRTMLNKHPDIMNDEKVRHLIKMKKTYKDGIFYLSKHSDSGVGSKLLVYLDKIDDYSMNILVYTFSISIKWEEWLKVKQEILKEIILIIDASSLELAITQEEIQIIKKESHANSTIQ